jgi:hypothetical protein
MSSPISSPLKMCQSCRKKAVFYSRAQQLATSPEKTCEACAFENNINNEDTKQPVPIEYPSPSDISDTINNESKDDTNVSSIISTDTEEKKKNIESSSWNSLLVLFLLSIAIGILFNFSIKSISSFTSTFMAQFLT